MLTISKPLSAGQARTYHEREFASQGQNYWSRDRQGYSEWQGKTGPRRWGLQGPVGNEEVARLTEGQHPLTGEQLVRHQATRRPTKTNRREVTSAEHRAGWDGTISAPKSVSITALVGGDDRAREAHRESVRVALGELNGTLRRGLAMSISRRRRGSSLPRPSSTTRRGQSMVMLRPSSIPMP